MKSPQEKKTGLLNRLKTAFSEGEGSLLRQELKDAEQIARILCQDLSSWGLTVNIPVDYFPQTTKLEIADSPIRWVDITLVVEFQTADNGGYSVVITHNFIIPDSRHLRRLKIEAIPRRRHGWILGGYGKLIDIRWKGDDSGTGVSRDQEIKASIMSLINEKGKPTQDDTVTTFLEIHTRPKTSCWVISTVIFPHISFKLEEWREYESIAKRLLAINILE